MIRYQVIGEGNFTSPEAREKFKSIIATWKLVFQDYLNANKESLKEAAKLFGKDLTQLQSMMAAQMNNAKPPQSANEMISQMNNVKMPQMGNGMNQRVEQVSFQTSILLFNAYSVIIRERRSSKKERRTSKEKRRTSKTERIDSKTGYSKRDKTDNRRSV